jgi:small-conductance mechanosensitive channel
VVKEQIIYISIVNGLGVIGLILAKFLITRQEKQRLKSFRNVEDFHALQGSFPEKHSERRAKKEARESIGGRYSIIRKMIFVIIAILWLIFLVFPFLGDMPATIISMVTTATAVIVGIAARPYVENLISGLVISFSDFLKIGDTVTIDGNYGTVEDITLTHSLVKIWDWRRLIVPNRVMVDTNYINYDTHDSYIYVYVEFYIAYGTDIEKIKETAITTAASSEYAHKKNEPEFWVVELDKEAVKCWIAAWAEQPSEGWLLRADIREKLLKEINILGVEPHYYNQRVERKGAETS